MTATSRGNGPTLGNESPPRSILNEELTALLAVEGYACLTFHPRADIGISRAARLPMVKRLADLAATHGARPARCGELAERMLQEGLG
ncbi:hypothetical protein [Bosea sp. LC85]|uniref:hypothetical protein n=1 Tax=Bosea sp. LC85 TaxID=1502851 RepID=UPI0005B9CC8E|nr:hypothetical protein [Bosea sp. LC85]